QPDGADGPPGGEAGGGVAAPRPDGAPGRAAPPPEDPPGGGGPEEAPGGRLPARGAGPVPSAPSHLPPPDQADRADAGADQQPPLTPAVPGELPPEAGPPGSPGLRAGGQAHCARALRLPDQHPGALGDGAPLRRVVP